MFVYGFNENRAMIKAVELLVGKAEANVLAKSLVPQDLRVIYDKIDLLAASSDYSEYSRITEEVTLMAEKLEKDGKLPAEDKAEIVQRYEDAVAKLEFLIEDESIE